MDKLQERIITWYPEAQKKGYSGTLIEYAEMIINVVGHIRSADRLIKKLKKGNNNG